MTREEWDEKYESMYKMLFDHSSPAPSVEQAKKRAWTWMCTNLGPRPGATMPEPVQVGLITIKPMVDYHSVRVTMDRSTTWSAAWNVRQMKLVRDYLSNVIDSFEQNEIV